MSDSLTDEGKQRPAMGIHPGLWVGVLLPPVIWVLQMQINYWAVRGACARGTNVRLYPVTIVALLIIVCSGLCAWFSSRRSIDRERSEWGAVVSNSRFMFALGLLSCLVFFIAVTAQGLAAIVFHPCQL